MSKYVFTMSLLDSIYKFVIFRIRIMIYIIYASYTMTNLQYAITN